MFSGQSLYLIVLLVLQLFYEVFSVVLHLVSHLLHLQIVLLFQIIRSPLELLPQLGLSLVVLGFEGEGIVLLTELLLLE